MLVDTALGFESRTRPNRWGVGLPLLVGGGVAAGFAALHFRDPHVEGSWGLCPFQELTGYWCPGCGGLRGLHNLTDGRVLDAIQSNVLIVPLLLGFLVFWSVWLVRAWRGDPRPRLPKVLPRSALWVVLVLLFAFTVLRNTPWGTWLAPV